MQGKSFIFISIAILACLGIIPASNASEEEIVVIINRQTTIQILNLSTLVDIYTNNKTKWENGEKIHVSMLKKGPVHDVFAKELIGMAPKKLVSIWKKVIFTGLGTPPKVLTTEADMIAYVAATKGAIGYIRASTASIHAENVKVFKLK